MIASDDRRSGPGFTFAWMAVKVGSHPPRISWLSASIFEASIHMGAAEATYSDGAGSSHSARVMPFAANYRLSEDGRVGAASIRTGDLVVLEQSDRTVRDGDAHGVHRFPFVDLLELEAGVLRVVPKEGRRPSERRPELLWATHGTPPRSAAS